MHDRNHWIRLLESTEAMLTGHFLLSSGRHSDRYIQCAKVLESPENASALGQAIVGGLDIQADRVASPPLGGILIGYEVARHAGVPFLFPERGPDGVFQLRRGFTLRREERICIVEDVITTGRTTRELVALVKGYGAIPVALACIVDRSETHEIDGLPIASVLRLQIPTYDAVECPLCAQSIPVQQPGSRHDPGGVSR